MNNYKFSIIFASIGIVLVSLFMMVCTYAYFTVDVVGEPTDIKLETFNENTNIIYSDTSNVSMVNAYTGDEIVKTFSIENTSNSVVYYDILLKNVVNNFENKEDLVYSIESDNDGASRLQSTMPSDDESISSYVMIKPHVKQSYTMKITFINKNEDQSDNMNKTFSSNIDIVPSSINVNDKLYKNNTLLEQIVKNVNYSDSNEDGIYYTTTNTYGYPVYYYKGSNNLNNNVVFNDMCFKIIRTDENMGIRLIYNGRYENNVCSSLDVIKISFNNKNDSNAYVGYMYGVASSNNYKNEHNNTNSSNIKIELDKWYKENIKDEVNISNDSVFCNNRKTNSFKLNGVAFSKLGYAKNNSGYYPYNNLNPSYSCDNINDRFSKSYTNSNKLLEYPVGLVSVDELLFAGVNYESNYYNYLATSYDYWTITPAYFNGSSAYNYAVVDGKIKEVDVSYLLGLRPVISLKKDTLLISGDGSLLDPYIVK